MKYSGDAIDMNSAQSGVYSDPNEISQTLNNDAVCEDETKDRKPWARTSYKKCRARGGISKIGKLRNQ